MSEDSNLSQLSNQELIKSLDGVRAKERILQAYVILHLAEVDRRKLYRDEGCSSLFAYCVERLGYSESSAYRRIQAARVMDKQPEVYHKLRDGRLNLCAVAELGKVVLREADSKVTKKLLSSSEGKSKRQVEQVVAELLPAKRVAGKEVIRVQAKHAEARESRASYRVAFSADAEFMEAYEQVKRLLTGISKRYAGGVCQAALRISRAESSQEEARAKGEEEVEATHFHRWK